MSVVSSPVPGAKRSTQAPKLENVARRSTSSEAATTSAAGMFAGESWHESVPVLPAATTTVTPLAMAAFTAVVMAGTLVVKLRLRLATAGLTACAVTQSIPASTVLASVVPEQPATRTATSWARTSTPTSSAPTSPATRVPWPLQSWAVPSLSTKSYPLVARPAKSGCAILMPLSTTYTCTVASPGAAVGQ